MTLRVHGPCLPEQVQPQQGQEKTRSLTRPSLPATFTLADIPFLSFLLFTPNVSSRRFKKQGRGKSTGQKKRTGETLGVKEEKPQKGDGVDGFGRLA